MSDSPPSNLEDLTDAPQPGGWYQPGDESGDTWREPEPTQRSGWRISAMPSNLQTEPQQIGGWHLPDDEDTPFTPDDTIMVARAPDDDRPLPDDAEAVPPEAMAEMAGPPPEDAFLVPINAPAPPEDMLPEDMVPGETASGPATPDVTAPEDMLYLIEHDQPGDEEELSRTSWAEYTALQSLSDEDALSGVERGEDSPISAALALSAAQALADSDDLPDEALSGAERAVLGAATGETEVLDGEVVDQTGEAQPGDYAQQQIARLMSASAGGSDAPATDGPAEQNLSYAQQQIARLMGEDTGAGSATQALPDEAPASDAASFAQQQVARLMQDQGQAAAPAMPAAPPEELSPRELDLLRQFRETEAGVSALRSQYQSGAITQEDFVARLRDQMILDDNQVWWMMGVETDQWYKSENNQWIEATPDIYAKAQRIEQQNAAQQFGGEYGSIPYLTETPPAATGSAPSYGEYTEQPGINDVEFPLPRRVPIDDPEATVPGPSAFAMNTQPGAAAQPTVPSAAYSEPTVMAQPVNYGTIEAPIDDTEPPEYDLDEEDDGELYREAVDDQRRSTGRILLFGGGIAAALAFLLGGGFVALATMWYQDLTNEWEAPVAALASQENTPFQTVIIQDREGNRIATLGRSGEDRRPVTIDQISPYVIHGLLALKDPDFYNSWGSWTLTDTLSAYASNTTGGSITPSASPITLEVARQLVLRDSSFASDSERALAEAVVTNLMMEQFTPSQILEFYLNEIAYFGNLAYGVEAAAQFYFGGTSAAELNYPEAALLIGLIDEPATYDPIRSRSVADDRLDQMMRLMANTGCIRFEAPLPAGGVDQLCVSTEDLTSPQTVRDKGAVFADLRTEERDIGTDYPHFVQLVQAQLENVYGNEMYRSGYVITTTLDSGIQSQAQAELQQQVALLRVNNVNIGAAMVTDPRTGEILALVGSHDFDDTDVGGENDQTRLYHLPGDIIDPIIYAMALEGYDANGNGLEAGEYATAATILWDVPTQVQGGVALVNETGGFSGPVPLRFAMGNAINIATVKVFDQFGGVANYREVASRMGLRFANPDVVNEDGSGIEPVRLFDLMEVYGTIANDGTQRSLYAIIGIRDANGNEIAVAPELLSQETAAIGSGTANVLQNILSDDSARQPRYQAGSPLVINGVTAAGVTATAVNGTDLWTVGFTGNRVVGVWMGNNADQPTFNNMTGFRSVSPLWNEIMDIAIAGTQTPPLCTPQITGSCAPTIRLLQVCSDTGAVFQEGSACANVRNEVFADGRFPPQGGGLTTTLSIDSWTGLRSNDFCPNNVISQTFVNISDTTAINWINSTQEGRNYANAIGIPWPAVPAPTAACDQTTQQPSARIDSPQGGQTVQGTLTITGQIGEALFSRYELQIAPGGSEDYQVISTATTPQPNANSVLGTWDTTSVPNGEYTLRLAVFANNDFGGFVYRTANITVNNPEPTPTPTPTLAPPTPTPLPAVPTNPIPFDPLTPTPDPLAGPTPTIDPLGG